MVEYFEVIATTPVGVMIGTGSFVSKLLKSVLTAIEAVTNAISDKGGLYPRMQYLESKTATGLNTRYTQQEGLLRALIDSKLIQLFNATLAGQLLIMNDPDDKSGSSIMATTEVANFVKEIIAVPRDWLLCRKTALHNHLHELQTASPNRALTISPVALSQLNPAALRLVTNEDSGHHLRYCELKPDYWQLSSTLPNAAASKRPLAVREKPVSDKRQRMTALELVTSLSETELTAVCAAINTIHNEPEVSVATSADIEQEAIH